MIYVIISYFLIYSFLGWICEVLYCFVLDRHWTNRGFLAGPVCPIYGCGALAVLLVFMPFHKGIVLTFLFGAIVASVIEYVTSYLLERIFKLSLWDYSANAWNLNGRVCLKNSLLFGLLSVLLVKFIHPMVSITVHSIPESVFRTIVLLCMALFLYDAINTVSSFVDLRKKVEQVHALFEEIKLEFEKSKQLFEEDYKQRKELLQAEKENQIKRLENRFSLLVDTTNQKHKRILHAFPKLHSLSFREPKFNKIKDELKNISFEKLKK